MPTKTILITGSASGIGRAIALLAAEQGYRVIIHDISDSVDLNSVHNELPKSLKVFFDISNQTLALQRLAEIINNIGGIDILINNAGIMRAQTILEFNDDKAIEEYKVNVLGAIHCIQGVLPQMIKQKYGVIINISSFRGLFDNASMSSFTYGQTKSAIISATVSLAKELAQHNIRVNTVAPGYTMTNWAKNWSENSWKNAREHNLLKRPAQPEEIAQAVMFLASENASYITGEVLNVDGGYRVFGK